MAFHVLRVSFPKNIAGRELGHWEQIGEESRKWRERQKDKRVNWEDVILYAAGIAFWVLVVAYFVAAFSS